MKIINAVDVPDSFFANEVIQGVDVKSIIVEVREKGDIAVKEFTKKFDSIELENIEVTKEEKEQAYKKVDKRVLSSLKKAAKNIEAFAKKQYRSFKSFETKIAGNKIGQRIIPIQKVGCYVPGGRYPLPSSALMSVIPAKVAGVEEIIVCSPKISAITIVAADIAGADKIYRIGGVQAIAAMTYGTQSIPKVDKIVGPGNKYVTAAKKEVYGDVGIDFLAGPSEVFIIADETAVPKIIAADLLAQLEHDPSARADLVTTSQKIAEEVKVEVERQIELLTTKEVAKQALANGYIIIVKKMEEAIAFANKRAPEHLELCVKSPEQWILQLKNYGSLFIGMYSAEVFGDYCSGTNHALPTNGAARYTGGLSVKEFVKVVTYQEMTKQGAQRLIPIAATLAAIEGLDAHKKAAEIRKE
ncbi:MAG: histidinol dehydrogenase [Nanoarchaeota archaeon]